MTFQHAGDNSWIAYLWTGAASTSVILPSLIAVSDHTLVVVAAAFATVITGITTCIVQAINIISRGRAERQSMLGDALDKCEKARREDAARFAETERQYIADIATIHEAYHELARAKGDVTPLPGTLKAIPKPEGDQ